MRIVNNIFDFSNYVLDHFRINVDDFPPLFTGSPEKTTYLVSSSKTAALPTAIITRDFANRLFTKTPISQDALASITQYLPDKDAFQLAIHEKNPDLYFFNRKNIEICSQELLKELTKLLNTSDPNSQKKFQIESLHLNGFSHELAGPLFLESFIKIAKNCPQLHTLKISYCLDLSDTSLIKMAENCPQLHTLNVNGCSSITNASHIEIAKNCPWLHKLNIELNSTVTRSYLLDCSIY